MFINLAPFKNKNYKNLFLGQTISYFGSMMTYVAIPYQAYEITKNSFMVGLISSIQLVPLLIAGLYGGALADTLDRRKLLISSELGLVICTLAYILNAQIFNSYYFLVTVAGLSSALVGLHRPSMDAIIPQIVEKKDLNAVAALSSLRYAIGAVAGPALGGILISNFGATITYVLDGLTFIISIFFLLNIKTDPHIKNKNKANLNSILEGLSYAKNNPVILGSYLVDIIAMVFAMPIALYPQMADEWSSKTNVGLLYAALPIGAGIMSLFSKILDSNKRLGAGVIVSASLWGVFIIVLAFANNIYFAAAALILAGMADSVSAIYRSTIWNEVIPNNIRGRLGSLNMLSYMVGPLIGNMRAGTLAAVYNTHISVLSGGILCTIACVACVWLFPLFWSYDRSNYKV